jgi:hypothetical protein
VFAESSAKLALVRSVAVVHSSIASDETAGRSRGR